MGNVVITYKGKNYAYEEVSLELPNLKVDGSYQREEIQPHVANIVRNFNPFALKHLVVSKRKGTNNYFIIDGQQEWHALKELVRLGHLPQDFKVRVKLFHNLTKKQEADLYLLTQNNRKNTKGDEFKARLVREDKFAIEIRDILHQAGLAFNTKAGKMPPNAIPMSVINYVEKQKYNTNAFSQLIRVIQSAWAKNNELPTEAKYVPMLQGLMDALVNLNDIKESAIVAKLKAIGCDTAKEEGREKSNTNGLGQETLYRNYFLQLFFFNKYRHAA